MCHLKLPQLLLTKATNEKFNIIKTFFYLFRDRAEESLTSISASKKKIYEKAYNIQVLKDIPILACVPVKDDVKSCT